MGRHNRHEWLFTVDPTDPTRYLPPEEGGVLETPKPGTRAKYTKEARGLFGVMMRRGGEGEDTLVGERMKPFNYTGQKVVGPAAYNKAFWAEVRRVNSLKCTGTSRYIG